MAGGPGSYLFGEEEKRELNDVMESGYLFRYAVPDTEGFCRKVERFEDELQAKLGVKHAVATSSGTGALLCCLAALGIGAGDEVIVPGYTFIASISAIVLSNAVPVLAEIDTSLTLDPNRLEELITERTKAIMAVHMLGNPCDMEAIRAIANKHKLYVIEDCCQAVGASYKGKRVGSFGEISAYSLNVFKTITAGDGGAVATDDAELYARAFGFHDQGHHPSRMGVEVGNRFIIGMNLRMNELTGAVALAQLRKLDHILDTLREKKRKLKSMLDGLPNFKFRRLNDEQGECATLLTLIFDTKELAQAFCEAVGGAPLSMSGWHVYNNMEQVLGRSTGSEANCPFSCPRNKEERTYQKHMLKNTDDILERTVNISIGVVDKGLGAAYGINICSTDDEIERVGKRLREVIGGL